MNAVAGLVVLRKLVQTWLIWLLSPEDKQATCVKGAGLSHLISILRDWHCPLGHNAWGHRGLLEMK